MSALHVPRPSKLTTMRHAALLFLACVAIGGLAGGTFGLLCGVLDDLLRWQFGKTIAWGTDLALAGAVTGVLLGLFALSDRLRNAAYWERRSGHPQERDRASVVHTTAHAGRLVALDEPLSDKPPAYDTASRDGYLW